MSVQVICYLPLGYPSLDESLALADTYTEGGCDLIEIGWPTDNAYLDNEMISSRMAHALQSCGDPERYFAAIAQMKGKHTDIPMIILIYDHSIQEIGQERFVSFCRENGIQHIILVGKRDGTLKEELIQEELKVSCYVPFHLPDWEVNNALHSNGFIYLQAKPGAEVKQGFEKLEHCIRFLKSEDPERLVYCGVGISTPEDIRMAGQAGADGIFLGSSILKRQDDPVELKRYLLEIKQAAQSVF